jgi:hypothetical protein
MLIGERYKITIKKKSYLSPINMADPVASPRFLMKTVLSPLKGQPDQNAKEKI